MKVIDTSKDADADKLSERFSKEKVKILVRSTSELSINLSRKIFKREKNAKLKPIHKKERILPIKGKKIIERIAYDQSLFSFKTEYTLFFVSNTFIRTPG